MSATEQTSDRPSTAARPNFAATRWSVVLAARQPEASAQSREALETLCRHYWQPLYAFVRRQGHSPQDAQDLTQDFFALLLEKHYLGDVDPQKGKFRSFLLAALKHFLANEWDKRRAQKRGGGKTAVSIDIAAAETSCASALATHESADRLYDRRWAMTLLERTMERLEREHQSKAKAFERLRPTLVGDRNSIPYAQIARELDSTEGAVKVAVHRLRQRYREILREEIADTVASKSEVEDELRYLFSALG